MVSRCNLLVEGNDAIDIRDDDLLRLLVISWFPYVSVVEGVQQEVDPAKIFQQMFHPEIFYS